MSTITTLLCAALLISTTASSASRSIRYLNNVRHQQSIPTAPLNADDLLIEAKQLESLLGLGPHPPHHPPSPKPPMNASSVQFVRRVYDHLTFREHLREAHRTKRSAPRHKRSPPLSPQTAEAIAQNALIRTFASHARDVARPNFLPKPGSFKSFHVARAGTHFARLSLGQLHIYQKPTGVFNETQHQLRVFAHIPRPVDDGRERWRRVANVVVRTNYCGWLELPVSVGLQHWLNAERATWRGSLYIAGHRVGRPEAALRLGTELGLHLGETAPCSRQPFLVGYFRRMQPPRLRLARSPSKAGKSARKQSRWQSTLLDGGGQVAVERRCQLRNRWVHIRDTRLHDIIISPQGYEASYCGGECRFPLGGDVMASNNARIMAMMHVKDAHRYPAPNCVPAQLGPMKFMYFTDDGQVDLQYFDDMVAKQCECA